MDAPHHFLEKGAKIHEISLEKLVSEAALIKSKKSGCESITKTDIQNFEKKHGKIERSSSVIFSIIASSVPRSELMRMYEVDNTEN